MILDRTKSFDLFLIISGTAVLIGAALLLLLGCGQEPTEAEQAIEEEVPHPGGPPAAGVSSARV
ncbi:MAG: hypothetical protein QM676_03345 [Novosphingobium sp.]